MSQAFWLHNRCSLICCCLRFSPDADTCTLSEYRYSRYTHRKRERVRVWYSIKGEWWARLIYSICQYRCTPLVSYRESSYLQATCFSFWQHNTLNSTCHPDLGRVTSTLQVTPDDTLSRLTHSLACSTVRTSTRTVALNIVWSTHEATSS